MVREDMPKQLKGIAKIGAVGTVRGMKEQGGFKNWWQVRIGLKPHHHWYLPTLNLVLHLCSNYSDNMGMQQ